MARSMSFNGMARRRDRVAAYTLSFGRFCGDATTGASMVYNAGDIIKKETIAITAITCEYKVVLKRLLSCTTVVTKFTSNMTTRYALNQKALDCVKNTGRCQKISTSYKSPKVPKVRPFAAFHIGMVIKQTRAQRQDQSDCMLNHRSG